MTQETIDISPVWAGGPGDLESNWITGYLENTGSDGVTSFVDWIYGAPLLDAAVGFQSSVTAPGTIDTDVAAGGILDGSLTCATVTFNSGSDYVLNGQLSTNSVNPPHALVYSIAVEAGDLTVSGGSSVLMAGTGGSGGVFVGESDGALTVAAGATLSASGLEVGTTGTGTATFTGAGSGMAPVTEDGIGVGFNPGGDGLLTISDGADVSVDDLTAGVADGTGTVVVSGAGSGLTLLAPAHSLLGLQLGVAFDGSAAGTGILSVRDGAGVATTELWVGPGSRVAVDPASALNVVTGGTFATSGIHVGVSGLISLNGGTLASGSVMVDVGGTISGDGVIDPNIVNNGTVIAATADATLEIGGPVSGGGKFKIDSGATLELDGSFAQNGTIDFGGTGQGTLILNDPVDFLGSITGLTAGDIIDFPFVNSTTAMSAQLQDESLTTWFSSGGARAPSGQQIDVSGTNPDGFAFEPVIEADPSGGTELKFEPTGLVQIQVRFDAGSGTVFVGTGSGLIIGPHTVLTAAHVVWRADPNQSENATTVSGESAFDITIAPYGGSGAISSFTGTLDPFVASLAQPVAVNVPRVATGPDTQISFYTVNDSPTLASLPVGSQPDDFAVIETSPTAPPLIPGPGSQYIPITPTAYGGGPANLEGLPILADPEGTPGDFLDGDNYVAESSVSPVLSSSGVYTYGANSFVPYPGTNLQSPVVEGMSGGPVLVNSTNGLLDVGVLSTTNTAVQFTAADYATIEGWTTFRGSLTVNSGTAVVSAGETTTGTIVENGGTEEVASGGVTIGTTVDSGAFEFVSSGGTATGTTMDSGGYGGVFGGTAISTLVNSGGRQVAFIGGTAVSTTVEAGGFALVVDGGTETSMTLSGGSGATSVVVDSGGTTTATTVGRDAYEYADSSGTVSGTVVESGGYEVMSGGTATGTTVNDGGTEVVYSGTESGTTMNLGGMIDLRNVPYVSGGSANLTSSGLLTVSVGGRTYQQQLSGSYVNDSPQLARDATGGTLVTITRGAGTVVVSSGVTSSGITLRGSATEVVLSGGTAIATTVSSGGLEYDYGVADSTVVSSGGTECVSSGGSANGTVVNSGGYQYVSGGKASATKVNFGGQGYVFSGGTADAAIVGNGGELILFSGAVASGTTVLGAGVSSGGEYVSSGGTAVGTVVSGAGAEQVVSSGGVASGTVVTGSFAFGLRSQQYVLAGGTATGTTVGSGGDQAVAGGLATGTVVSSGGTNAITAGGLISGAVMNAGDQYVEAGGVAIGTVISSGGFQGVYSGGAASNTVVSAMGSALIFSDGIISGTAVNSGGTEYVYSGGTALSTTLNNGGTEILSSGGTASGTLLNGGGTIDVAYLPYVSGGSVGVDSSTDVLTLSVGGQTYTQALSGNYADEQFGLAPDGNGGTSVTIEVDAQGHTITVIPSTGQTVSLDQLAGNQGIVPSGTIQSLLVNGPGTTTVSGTVSAVNLEVNTGDLSLTGGTVNTDPVTVDAHGNISGFGTVTGTVSNVGTITATGGTLELTGSVSGVGTLVTDPGATLQLDAGGGAGAVTINGGSLAAAGELDAGQSGLGGLLVENQATATTGTSVVNGDQGLDIGNTAGSPGDAIITGTQSVLTNTGEFIVGDGGVGALAIDAGGTVTTSAAATIANTASASDSSANVSGGGSKFEVAGALTVGDAGFGSLSVSQSATVTAASAAEATAAGGDGVITVDGSNSALALTGSLTVGSQGAGEVDILGGGTVTALDLTIGNANALSSGNVDVEGAGSTLNILSGGILNIGVAHGGSGILTIGTGATLSFAGTVVEAGQASYNNNGGFIDPDAVQFTSDSNSGGGVNQYDLYVENLGAVQITGDTGTWDTPMLLTGTSVADAVNNISGGSLGQWQLGGGGTLVINANTVDAGQAIVFEDAGDTLVIGQLVNGGADGVSGQTPTVLGGAENLLQAGGFQAAIWGYQAGDQILFDNLAVTSDQIVNGNTLELLGSGNTDLGSLTFFTKAGNKALGVTAMAAAAAQMACFAAGTLIETPDGPRAVETLAVGDAVVTLLGGPGRIVWVGSRAVDCRRHPRPETVWPVRIAAGAFGANVPVRDLWVSPDHAIYVDDVLIPAKHLVNGTTICQVQLHRVVYHHIELIEHDVVLAEGLPAETYLDTGDRAKFSGAAVIALHPDFSARMWEAMGCAPLVVTGPILTSTRARLRQRAARLVVKVGRKRSAGGNSRAT